MIEVTVRHSEIVVAGSRRLSGSPAAAARGCSTCENATPHLPTIVVPRLDRGIHGTRRALADEWIAGSSPAMTVLVAHPRAGSNRRLAQSRNRTAVGSTRQCRRRPVLCPWLRGWMLGSMVRGQDPRMAVGGRAATATSESGSSTGRPGSPMARESWRGGTLGRFGAPRRPAPGRPPLPRPRVRSDVTFGARPARRAQITPAARRSSIAAGS